MFNPFRCGRLPHDPVALARAPSLYGHPFMTMRLPNRLDRSSVPVKIGLYHNDVLPDCTAAGLANAASMVAAINGFDLAIDANYVPAFYAACVGCEPTMKAMAATSGANVLEVLRRQQSAGGFDIGSQSLVGLFGTLPISRQAIAASMAHLGHCCLGVGVSNAEVIADPGDAWHYDGNAVTEDHFIVAWEYQGLGDQDLVRVATWGDWRWVTWEWIENRTAEVATLFWRQLATDRGLDMGVDVDTLAGQVRDWQIS